jgi:2-polyprenyl-3-methyl-5-hydroxy-6-metoxy-1,4-benzoquinol methylase
VSAPVRRGEPVAVEPTPLAASGPAPPADAAKFRKYEQSGAYHWNATYTGGWRRSDPVAHARYDGALQRLARRLALPGTVGLDVGCGDGVMTYKLLRAGARPVGVDLEPDGVLLADRLLRRAGAAAAVACASAYRLPFADASMRWVVAIEVLEHLAEPRTWLAEVKRVLAPGGVVVITTPQQAADGMVRDPYHVHEFAPRELAALLAEEFAEVVVEGQFPAGLLRLYKRGLGWRPADLAVRLGYKALAAVGVNPFRLLTVQAPGPGWEGLIASGRKP